MPYEIEPSLPRESRGASWPSLIVSIAAGDDAALSQFYDETRQVVYGVILRIVSLPAVAEEVTMDVYLQVWRQACRYQVERGSVLSWLMLLARSRALDRLRSESVTASTISDVFTDDFDIVDQRQRPDTQAQVRQTQIRLSHLLLDLPTEQRQVILLSFYEGMSHIQISERLKLPLGTVKSRIRSAIGRFRQGITQGNV